LDAVGTVVDPGPTCLNELAGRDHRGMANESNEIALAAGFDTQNAEAVLGVVERDPVDQPGQDLGRGACSWCFRASGYDGDQDPGRLPGSGRHSVSGGVEGASKARAVARIDRISDRRSWGFAAWCVTVNVYDTVKAVWASIIAAMAHTGNEPCLSRRERPSRFRLQCRSLQNAIFSSATNAPHSEERALASKSAAAFAASNVSAVPLAIRSSRLLPTLTLRLTSHVGTPSCVNTNNINSPTSVQTAGWGHRAGNGRHSTWAICFP
jgi:hypothetical protein